MLNLYIYLLIYVGVLLVASYFVSKNQSKEDFLIAGRNRGTGQILLSKFAVAIGAAFFITYTGFSYEYGLGVFTMLIGLLAGYFLFGYWATPKIHEHSKNYSFYKIGDFVYHKTRNKTAEFVANWVSNINVLAWLLVGIIGGAKIISDFDLMPYSVAVFLTVLVVLAYIFLAGFRAVLITDVIQSFVILALLALITFSIIGSIDIISLLKVETGGIDLTTAFVFFMFGLISIFSQANIYQLCYAAKNKRKLKYGIAFAIFPILLVTFLLLLIGLFMASNSPGLDSGLVFTEALKHFLPASMLPIAIVLFFAGIMSSSDTNIYTIASHYAIGKSKNVVGEVRKSILGIILIALIISLLFKDVVDISILAGGLSMTLSFPMIYLIAGGINSRKFIASTLLGLASLIFGLFIFGIQPVVAVPVMVFSLFGLLWR